MPTDPIALAAWLTVIAGGAAALGYLLKRVYQGTIRAWHAITEARRVLKAMWELVSYELNVNSGGSIKDNIHDMAVAQGKTQRDVVALRQDVQKLTASLHRAAEKFNPKERDY